MCKSIFQRSCLRIGLASCVRCVKALFLIHFHMDSQKNKNKKRLVLFAKNFIILPPNDKTTFTLSLPSLLSGIIF